MKAVGDLRELGAESASRSRHRISTMMMRQWQEVIVVAVVQQCGQD